MARRLQLLKPITVERDVAPLSQVSAGSGDLSWVAFYALTILLQVPSMIARGFVTGLIAPPLLQALTGPVGGDVVDLFVWSAALGPIARSLFMLVVTPGLSTRWEAELGGRVASRRERELYNAALAQLRAVNPDVRAPRHGFALDMPDLNAAVYGDTLMLTTGLLHSEFLAPVLAHELGHCNTIDTRLATALNYLAVWPSAFEAFDKRDISEMGFFSFLLWSATGILSGAIGFYFLRATWAAWFREREYAADAYAARLGQGEALHQMLEQHALPDDRPVPFRLLARQTHPPTELRLDHLSQATANAASQVPA